MQIVAHLDPHVLEQALLERIGAARPAHSLDPVLVVVPTVRLAEHVQRRLAAARPAWLGVQVLHLRALAYDVLAAGGAPLPALLSPRLLLTLVRRTLAEQPENPWAGLARERPRIAARVQATLQDLRESGIEPAAVAAACRDNPSASAVAELHRRYAATLEGLARRSWVDEAGLVQAALGHAPAYARARAAIFLHGAYELIGIHLALVQALDSSREVTVLLPARPGAPVSAYAERFASRHLLQPGATIGVLPDRTASDHPLQLHALYDERASLDPAPAGRVLARHAQGAAAEVRVACREALVAVRDGCPPVEIALVARGLTAFAAPLEEAFAQQDLPWTSSLQAPLRREPLAHDLLLLLRVVAEDFPRRATAELLRSPRIQWAALGTEPPRAHRVERFSREAAIIGGLQEWIDGLEAWAAASGAHLEDVRRIGLALRALDRHVDPARSRTFGEHARSLRLLVDTLLVHDADPTALRALDALRGLVDEMEALETVLGDTQRLRLAAVVAWLEEAVELSTLAADPEDRGGVRVLDAMQLRGLTFRRVHLLGLNSGQLPHPPREDPLLPDDLRRRLRETTGQPLPVKSEGRHEERLLLALLLGAGAARVDVSWQRADEAGRARTPSSALREVARLALGRPSMAALVEGATHVPSHPRFWLEWLVERSGLLSPEEERLLAILRARGPAPELDASFAELAPGLRMLRATEAFTMQDPAYDGRVGATHLAGAPLSVSALETLGRCPLRFFFRSVLRVRELDQEASAFAVEQRIIGQQVHALLEQVYRRLQDEGRLGGDSTALVTRARELVDEAWNALMSPGRFRIAAHTPALWGILSASWLDALHGFVRQDLLRLDEGGWQLAALEEPREEEIAIGEGQQIRLSARLDRRLAGPGGQRIGDYKTSGSLTEPVDPSAMLKADRLQVPLYWLLTGEAAQVELLGVGPTHAEAEVQRGVFTGFARPALRDGFLETLRVLSTLEEQGRFPFRSGNHCGWCAYQLACRRTHPPTLDREASAQDGADFHAVKSKNQRDCPTLALVRAAGPARGKPWRRR